ncbi:LysE family translocator [Microvirga pudoricolor]|uniref:LysE family translocator n=1 Tax=Microvirga pudoricolor TaxID=2778729 RepID=UPI001951685A|nr:LysE family translocator [Microvirga pudoricolor]MBM6592659.1 LysE family translocator [Microvirga pudoricolor]
MSLAALLAFAAIMFVGIVTPGPTVLLALTNGSRHGLRIAAYGMAGAVAADLTLVALVGLGLGALLAASEGLFLAVKWTGVAYLGFVGAVLMRARAEPSLTPVSGRTDPNIREGSHRGASPPSPLATVSKSFVMAMSNPKYYLFMSAFLPQFVVQDLPPLPQYLLLGAVIAALDLVVMSGYALLGYKAARAFSHRAAVWLDRLSGAALLGLAGSIALYRRAA